MVGVLATDDNEFMFKLARGEWFAPFTYPFFWKPPYYPDNGARLPESRYPIPSDVDVENEVIADIAKAYNEPVLHKPVGSFFYAAGAEDLTVHPATIFVGDPSDASY